MDSKTINLISYNSTGLDMAKVKWINDLMETFDVDLLQIQEHFKAIKSVDNYFKKNFTDFDSFVMPAIRDNENHAGRPKGGLTQFVKKGGKFKKERISSSSWRVQCQVLHVENYKLLWMNIYMPTDPQTMQLNETELVDTLAEIEKIIEKTKFHDVICGGDYNYDQNRTSRFCSIINEFLEKHGLVSVWSKFPADFTYQHNNLISFSTIDHFFVTERFLDNCVDASPIHLGDNRSNHSPIMLKVKLPDATIPQKPEKVIKRKPDWNNASDDDKDEYHDVLHEKLLDLPVPESLSCSNCLCKDPEHSKERDNFIIDNLNMVIESTFECLPVKTIVTNGNKKKPTTLPGWNEHVKPYKDDSLFWHSVWLSAGRPTSGGLFTVMKWTRNKYHLAVRRHKRESNQIITDTIMQASISGYQSFFDEMKRILNGKASGQDIPDSLEGKVTPDDVLEKFKECYATLYNSAESRDEMIGIKDTLENIISNNLLQSEFEISKVSSAIVNQAIDLMKSNKSDVSGSYTSDVFKNAPAILVDNIAAIFRSFLTHGTISKEILACAFLPLFKGGLKDPSKFNSYRAIAGASQLLKLFEYVILILWGDKLTTDSLQFGFKKGVSTTQCSWLVLEVANYYVKRGGSVASCFCDATKAFDLCQFSKLFNEIIKKGVPAVAVRALIYAYEEQNGSVKLGSKTSDQFTLTNGTRQGSVLSPYLFSACYLDGLLVKLRALGYGCYVAGVWIGAMAYADDLVLLAPSYRDLQVMVTVCEKYAQEFNIQFSTDPNPVKSKTKCVLFNGKNTVVDLPLVKLDGKELPWVPKVEHLGHVLHQSLSMNPDIVRARASFMTRASDMRDQLHFADPELKMKAIQLYVCDGYGSMIWDFTKECTEKYFRAWNIQARHVWNVHPQTHTNLVESFFCKDLVPLRSQIYGRYPKFITKLRNSPSKEIRFMINIVENDPKSVTCLNIRFLSDLAGEHCLSFAPWRWKQMLPKNEIPVNETWKTSWLECLLEIRKCKDYGRLNLTEDQFNSMLDSLCIS